MQPALSADEIEATGQSRSSRWPAWIVFACSLVLTLVPWRYGQEDIERQSRREFDAEISMVRADFDARIVGYTQTLRAAAVLFATSNKVSRKDWHDYVAGLGAERDYPVMRSLSFARAVNDRELDALADEARLNGATGFAQSSPVRRGRHVMTVFTEPATPTNVMGLGYDMWQDPRRREAIENAYTPGVPAITRPVTLKVDEQSDPVPGFVMYLPVMLKSGGEVFGYVLGEFSLPALMTDLLKPKSRGVSLSIHDGAEPRPDNLFYQSETAGSGFVARFVHSETVTVGGRVLTLTYASLPELEARADKGRSVQVLAGGLLVSVLLFILVLVLTSTRDRALRMAHEMTHTLRESEARFRLLVELAPDAVVEYDVDEERFVDANIQAEKLFGCSREELLQAGPERFYPPEQFGGKSVRESIREAAERALAGEQLVLDRTILNARGRLLQCELRLVSMHMTDRRLVRSSFLDVTERKQGEINLALTNKRLGALIEAIPDAIFFKDGDSRWLIANEPAKRLFHLHDIPWQDKTEMELAALHPQHRAAHELAFADDEKAWEAGRLAIFSETIVGEDGRPRDFEVRKVPVFGPQGGRQALVVIGRDVTERNRAEADLRVAAITFESQEGMMIADADKVILRVNRSFTEITGYGSEEAVGRKPRLLSSGRHVAAFYDAMWESVNGTGTWQGEIWNRRRNGEIYPAWLSITAVKGPDGNVTHFVSTFTDIARRKAAEDEIRNLAFYDPLTRLPNRRLMHDRLRQALTGSARHERHGALMLLDLDDFKTLNDTLGHDVGDQFLVEVAIRMQSCVRQGDTVARLGGDEFVVIIEDLDAEAVAAMQAENVAVKIRAALSQPFVLDLSLGGSEGDTSTFHCTSSIGIALFRDQSLSVDELMKRADTAMYQAKAAGRNTLRFFDPDMQAVVSARATLNADLRAALRENRFLLHYQPQVDGKGRVTGAEALVRWQHPRRGLVFPSDFISLAEDSGLILPLGQWVLEAACRQLAVWAGQADWANLTVAVNVSSRQFHQKDFVAQVLAVLRQTGANPQLLKLELTESLLLHDVEDIIAKMTALKAEGVTFSLDDFGTGYSSLSYLKRLPLSQLKIDQSFVRDVLTDNNDAVIARTIIALGQSLGLTVMAEGVETEAQREFLARQGCDAYQGYLFGQPGAAETLLVVNC